MMTEDEPQKLLRRLAERKAQMIERIAHGGVSSDNVAEGYRDLTGQVKGLSAAEDLVREVFRSWLPELPGTARAKGVDYGA